MLTIREAAMGSGRRGAATGDVRLDRRGAWLIERIVATGSLCLREVGGTRGGEMGAHRYPPEYALARISRITSALK